MPPRQLHCPRAECKLGIWLTIGSSDRSTYCMYAIESLSIPHCSTDGKQGVQPPSLPILQGAALGRLRWFKKSLPRGRMKTVMWFFSWLNGTLTFPGQVTGNRRKMLCFFVQPPGPCSYSWSLEVWITHTEAFTQIKCCAPLWKITSRNMVQMMQIQGMRYGVENSLKPSFQEVSSKIVVCTGNGGKKNSPSLKAKLVHFFLGNEIAKVHFRYFLALFRP